MDESAVMNVQPETKQTPSAQPHAFRLLLLNKTNLLLFFFFFTTNIALFFISFYNLSLFAKNAPVFLTSQSTTVFPTLLLQSSFTCTSTINYFFCGSDRILFWVFVVLFEIGVIWKTYLLRKAVHNILSILYFFFLQTFIVATLITNTFAPIIVVQNLIPEAARTVEVSFKTLNTPTQYKNHGIISSAQAMNDALQLSSLQDFKIVEIQPERNAVLQFNKISDDKKDTFYRAILISQTLRIYLRNNQPKLSANLLYFPNKTLIVNKTTKVDLDTLLPSLTKKMIQESLPSITVWKNDPKTTLLEDNEYITYQKQEEEKIKQQFEAYMTSITAYIKDAEGILARNQQIVADFPIQLQQRQQAYDTYNDTWGNWYTSCISQLGPSTTCEDGRNKIATNLQILSDNIKQVEENKKNAEEYLPLQQQYKKDAEKNLLSAQANYQDFLANPVTPELQAGIFYSPDTIYIRFYTNQQKSFNFYLGTYLHEYLHYFSSQEKRLESFLEEGYTDYLKKEIHTSFTHASHVREAYPYEITTIKSLLPYIEEEKMTAIYFTKDENKLKQLFEEKFEPDTYDTFLMTGKDLFYTPLNNSTQKRAYAEKIKQLLSTREKK